MSNAYTGGASTSTDAQQTENAGYVTRMVENLTMPLTTPHSLTIWLGMLALGGIAVFVWTRLLHYIRGE